MPFLRQSTAQVILFGPCLDIGDGVTEETALTLVQADMRLSKDGGAFAQKSVTGNATHDSDGWYATTLSIADTATVGELRLNVHQPANMLPVWDRWWVLEEAVYDNIYGAGAAGPNIGKTGYALTTADWNVGKSGYSLTLADWNVGKSGYSLTQTFPTNFSDLAVTASTGLVSLNTGEHNLIADALLKRDWSSVTGEAARSVLNALRFLRNKWSLTGSTLTVTKEDDTASAWTSEVVATPGVDPITESDPT